MHAPTLSEIWIYPVKSLAGFRVPLAHASWAGLQHDRQWMVIDEHGNFLTQRKIPGMALVRARVVADGLLLSAVQHPADQVLVPFSEPYGSLVSVKVWNDIAHAHLLTEEANLWLSSKLDQEVSIVAMDSAAPNRKYHVQGHASRALSFADDFPYHLVNQSSVDHLGVALGEKIDIRRFRPNFVITGCAPFHEDQFDTITIGEAKFAAISACERCVVVNIDPRSAEKGKQPLKALASISRQRNKVTFGQNVIATHEGIVAEGDHLHLAFR